jgi:hypothetical protein
MLPLCAEAGTANSKMIAIAEKNEAALVANCMGSPT